MGGCCPWGILSIGDIVHDVVRGGYCPWGDNVRGMLSMGGCWPGDVVRGITSRGIISGGFLSGGILS